MKILFIVPYAPNLIRVRAYQLICALAERQHQVTVATLWTNEEEQTDLQRLRELGIRVVAQRAATWRSLANTVLALPTRTPLQAVYSWQPALADNIRQLMQTEVFDVVHVEHLRGARYGLFAKSLKQKNNQTAPIVWDSVDCISHLFEQAVQNSRSRKGRLLTGLDLTRTRRYEGQLVHAFDRVLVTSPADKAALTQLASHWEAGQARSNQGEPRPQNGYAHLHVLPNGVDLSYFAANSARREPATIVFSGKMSYHANITAALHLVNDIMPQVWVHCPDVKIWIVGKDPSPQVRALEQCGPVSQPPVAGQRPVTVTGTVADLRPYLQQATIAAAPIPYGAGIQNKVLEAMACAAPVIASPQASSALQIHVGQDLLVAPDAKIFAETILHLLKAPLQQTALGQSGRAYVENHHSWHAVVGQLEAIYQTAIRQHASLHRA
ncbi:MAG: glycosyltransferase [Chloroflexi bacterium]|nr:glycosyltransferase [Chloroflexota bacterium]